MEDFIQLVIAGVAMGAIYAIIALSFVLTYNAGQALNFAIGELLMIGAFIDVTFVNILGWNPWLSIMLTGIIMFFIGFIFERGVFHPIKNSNVLYFAIATSALAIALKNTALVIWGADPRGMKEALPRETYDLLGVTVSSQLLFICIVTVLLLIALYVLFYKTRLGRKMRATAQISNMAQMLGVKTDTILGGTFALSTLLAGVAGWLLGPVVFVYPTMGGSFMTKAFIAVVIGGFGSLPGAVVGGLFFGLTEVFVATYLSSTYKDVISFVILLLLLLVAPRGIFGEAVSEKV